jgi:hypothetical protein
MGRSAGGVFERTRSGGVLGAGTPGSYQPHGRQQLNRASPYRPVGRDRQPTRSISFVVGLAQFCPDH